MSEPIELVYMVPFIDVTQNGNNFEYKYRKLNGGTDINKRSPDKEKYVHCYDQLVPGKDYVVITVNHGPHLRFGRWVYETCYELDDPALATMLCERLKTIDPDHKVPGYQTTKAAFAQAVKDIKRIWMAKQKLKEANKFLDDLLVF